MSKDASPASSALQDRLKTSFNSDAKSGEDDTETTDQTPFRSAWNHALSQEDISGVASQTSKSVGSAETPQSTKLTKNRLNTDGVAVVLPQTPATPVLPLAVALAVPTPSANVPSKAAPSSASALSLENDATSTEAQAPAPSTDPVAFAAKIHRADATAFEPPPATNEKVPTGIQTETQSVSATEQSASDAAAYKEMAQGIEQAGGALNSAAAASPVAPPHLSAVHSIEAVPLPSAPAAPVKDISLHIAGPQNVEIRVSEQSGEIRVDVRTADAALAQDLRGGLHELVSKLDAKGFTTDIAAPSESPLTAAHTGDSGLLQDQSSGKQQSGAQQDEQQQRHRQSQNQEAWSRQNQDSWAETLSTNIEELSV